MYYHKLVLISKSDYVIFTIIFTVNKFTYNPENLTGASHSLILCKQTLFVEDSFFKGPVCISSDALMF